jgi:hypothetical protein
MFIHAPSFLRGPRQQHLETIGIVGIVRFSKFRLVMLACIECHNNALYKLMSRKSKRETR